MRPPHACYSERSSGPSASPRRPTHNVDVLVEEAGTICLFHLVTDRAEAWVRLRPDRGWYTLVGALVVDRSDAEAVSHWMRAEGLGVGSAAMVGSA